MTPTNHWNALKSAGTVPPPSPEVLAHARRELATATRRRTIRRRLVTPVLAAAGSVAAVLGAVAVYQTAAGPTAVPEPAIQPSRTGSSPASSAPSATPTEGVAASCVSMYTPAELKKRAFAFDGVVLKIVADRGGAMSSYLLTFQVNEWFKPADGARTVTVRTYNPPEGSSYQVSTEFPDYTVGSRLLITGEPQWGGTDPLENPIASGCGFSRAYSAADAVTWRKLLSK